MIKIKPIAIYLPQFHPIPENDEWWGKGFTEWTNVTKAKPLYRNHYQPKLSTHMGFYDLRSSEVREGQALLAAQYGIEGFAYYHYWFKGTQLLQRPFNEVLKTGKPDFPFCLIWANETWSRRWLGEEKEILLKQEYSLEDDKAHARYLTNAFKDKRYITKDGRPVFIIYRPFDLPDATATIDIIKQEAVEELGIEPFIIANFSTKNNGTDLLKKGFDGLFSFRPQLGVLRDAFIDGFSKDRLLANIKKHKKFSGTLKLYDYDEALSLMQAIEPVSFENTIPSVFVSWDNTARRGRNGIIIFNSTPASFQNELNRITNKLSKSENNLGFVFINAWNEWAEGNYLEPDTMNNDAYLKAVKNVVEAL